MRVKGKITIVTGATAGIGRSTAYVLAREGSHTVVTFYADTDREETEKLAEDIKQFGGKALVLKVDISDGNDVKQMVQQTVDVFGGVDILVNNAAFLGISFKLFHDSVPADWKPEIDTTLVGTLRCCHSVIPQMMKQKSGRIINVTSDAGKMGDELAPVYSACKAGIAGFSRALARGLATQGITVNCVSPGPIATKPMLSTIEKYPHIKEIWIPRVPMRRLGEPEDIANIIAFLASEDAKYITGQEYSVNGGLWM